MEAEGVHYDGLICPVYPQSQSIILALVLFSIGIFHTQLLCLQPQRAASGAGKPEGIRYLITPLLLVVTSLFVNQQR